VNVVANGIVEVELIDYSGRTVKLDSTPAINLLILNVETLPTGIYLVRTTTSSGTVDTKRLVKL
jgi:hypothetical protein